MSAGARPNASARTSILTGSVTAGFREMGAVSSSARTHAFREDLPLSGAPIVTREETQPMTDRRDIERLLLELYAARVRGDLPGLCATFTSDATFQIAGASSASPIMISAVGVDKYRPLLAMMVKTFKLRQQE